MKKGILLVCLAVAVTVSAEITLVDPWNPLRSYTIVDRLRKARPFFFAYGPEGVAELRRKVAGDTHLAAKFRQIRERCDKALEESVAVPSRGAEWPSWYTCRKCASWLKEREKGVHVCTACGEVHQGVVYDDVVLFGVHQRLQKTIREMGYAYLVSGDRRYAVRAKDLLLAYAKAIEGPGYRVHDTQGKASSLGGNVYAEILVDSWWLVDIIAGYDSVAETMTEAERQCVETNLIRKIADRAEAHDRHLLEKIGNHETWHEAAYGLAGMVLRDPVRIGQARVMMYYQLSRGILPNGGWFEGAFDYHFFTMCSAVDFIAALGNVGVDIVSDFPPAFRKMFDYPLGLVGPDRILPALNDDKAFLFSRANRVPKQARVLDLYDRSRSWTDVPAIDRETPAQSMLFKEEGYAMLRGGKNALLFKFGPHGGWHGHFDKLSFVLWGNGECLSEDPGCCGYGNPKHFGWYKNTLSHNTLSADGVRQEAATGRLLAFRAEADWSAVAADAGAAIPGATVRRAIALCGPVVFDLTVATSETERNWEWAFHAIGRFESDRKGEPVLLPPPIVPPAGIRPDVTDGRESWNWTRNIRESAHDGTWRATWTTSRSKLSVCQRVSGGGTLRTADADGLIGEKSPSALALVASRVSGHKAVFATVMTLDGSSATVTAADDGVLEACVGGQSYRFECGGQRLNLINGLRPSAGPVETTFVVDDSEAYNAWPAIRALKGGLLVVYSHTAGHVFSEGKVGCSYARLSHDGARTWSDPVTFAFDEPAPDAWGPCGAAAVKAGDALFWHRYWKGAERWQTLVRTDDGKRFEAVAKPKLDPMPVQVMDPVDVPGLGLVSLWFSGDYGRQDGHSWGLLVSTDAGRNWRQQVVESGLRKADWPTEPSLVWLGGRRLLALGRCEQRCEGNPIRRLFSLTSDDLGRTWRRQLTNIGDVLESTPSVLHDRKTDELTLYYFQRGPGLLKKRTALAAEAFVTPTVWSEPRVVACGRLRRDWDSGNVNAVRQGGSDYLAYYAGNEKVSSVLVSVVGAGATSPDSWEGRRVLLLGTWAPEKVRALAHERRCEARVYATAAEAHLDYPAEAFARVLLAPDAKDDAKAVQATFPDARPSSR